MQDDPPVPDGVAVVVDARGSHCPGALMELIVALKHARRGDFLLVLADDPGSAREIPEWLAKVGQRHVSTRSEQGILHIMVEKTRG
jgi:TusA-related sulfurtransferase